MTKERVLVLDTCVLINLLASGEIENILKVAAQRSFICSAVEKESIYLRSEDPAADHEAINLLPLVNNGVLIFCQVEAPDEEQLYVNYAVQLDDGEAMALAIALTRNWGLATDEKKARHLYKEAVGNDNSLTTTSQLIRSWVEAESISDEYLKLVLLRIERRAFYRPSNWDLNNEWWASACR